MSYFFVPPFWGTRLHGRRWKTVVQSSDHSSVVCKTLKLPWDLFGVKVCADSTTTKNLQTKLNQGPLCVYLLLLYTRKKIIIHINLWKFCWYHAYFFWCFENWFSVLEYFQAKKKYLQNRSNFSASWDNWIELNARPGFWREYYKIK